MKYKKCTRCGESRSTFMFDFNKNGLLPYCKDCEGKPDPKDGLTPPRTYTPPPGDYVPDKGAYFRNDGHPHIKSKGQRC